MKSRSLSRIQRSPLEENNSCKECDGNRDSERVFRSPDRESDEAFETSETSAFLQDSISDASGAFQIQPKLEVSDPEDDLEKEADRVADQVVGDSDTAGVSAASGSDDEKVQAKPISSASATGGADVSGSQAAKINGFRGGGAPLPTGVQDRFSSKLGADLSDVRVHTGADASKTAKSLGAKAFTLGRDIVFGDNRYHPESQEGQRLIAHELTHFIQQKSAPFIQRDEDPEQTSTPETAQEDDKKAEKEVDEAIKAKKKEKTWSFDHEIEFAEDIKVGVKFSLKVIAWPDGTVTVQPSELHLKLSLPKMSEVEFVYDAEKEQAKLGGSIRGIGAELSHEGEMNTLNLKVDILKLMWGPALDAIKDILELNSTFSAKIDFGEEIRIDKIGMSLGAALGGFVKVGGLKTGARFGGTLDVETEYATGKGEDDVDKTTAAGELYYEEYILGVGSKTPLAKDKAVAYGGNVVKEQEKEFKMATLALQSAYDVVYDKMVSNGYSGKYVGTVVQDLSSSFKQNYSKKRLKVMEEFPGLSLPRRDYFKVYEQFNNKMFATQHYEKPVRLLKMADEEAKEVDRVITSA